MTFNKTLKFLLLLTLISSCVDIDENKKNVIRDFEYYTGIHKDYKITTFRFEANQSYLEVATSSQNAQLLRQKFDFISADSMNIVKKRNKKKFVYMYFYLYDLDDLKDDYEYHFINDYDLYGYFFIGLSKDSSKLFICENFPELPPGL